MLWHNDLHTLLPHLGVYLVTETPAPPDLNNSALFLTRLRTLCQTQVFRTYLGWYQVYLSTERSIRFWLETAKYPKIILGICQTPVDNTVVPYCLNQLIKISWRQLHIYVSYLTLFSCRSRNFWENNFFSASKLNTLKFSLTQ